MATRERLYQEARAKLAALAATLPHAPDGVTVEVRTGTPADAIAAAAVDYGADLIVMSTPARGGHVMLASVADRLMHTARCPVLAVRPSGAARVHARERVA